MSAFTLDLATLSAGLLVARLVPWGSPWPPTVQPETPRLVRRLWPQGHRRVLRRRWASVPASAFAAAASVSEVAGGLLVALGFLGPVGPALIIGVMIVAAVTVHLKNGFFAGSNGFEVAYLYAGGAAALRWPGRGSYSVDALLGIESLWTPAVVWGVLAAGIVGGFANLLLRRSVPAPVAAQH